MYNDFPFDERKPLDRIEKWSRAHWHPAGEALSPGQVIRLLEGLSGEAEARFLALRGKRRKGRPEAARLRDELRAMTPAKEAKA